MTYEFTKAKIAQERKFMVSRCVVAGLLGAGGMALGVFMNDMQSLGDVFVTSVLAVAAGSLGFFAAR